MQSLGRVYTFIIACNQGELECVDVAQGQLPVGDGESFGSWKDHNRTNIETAWLMRDSLSPTGRTLFWVCALWLVWSPGTSLSTWFFFILNDVEYSPFAPD